MNIDNNLPQTTNEDEALRLKKNMAVANQMYIDAFRIKKNQIQITRPEISESEAHQLTVQYFISLHQGEFK
jgi:hypothetical protein